MQKKITGKASSEQREEMHKNVKMWSKKDQRGVLLLRHKMEAVSKTV